MDELFVHAALAEWYDFCSIYSQAFQQSLGSLMSIMLLDWDTFRLDVLASHIPTGCVLAQVAVGNDWHSQGPGGRPPDIIPFQRGWSYHLVPLFRGMLMGPQGIFGTAGHMRVSILCLNPLKKRLCATLVHLMGAYKKYIKMSHKIMAIRENTSLNVIKRNRKKITRKNKEIQKG